MTVFATAADLGLDSNDELNMLELAPLVGGSAEDTINDKLGILPPNPAPALSLGGIALLSGIMLLGLGASRRLSSPSP